MNLFNWFRNRRKENKVPLAGPAETTRRVRAVQLALTRAGHPVRNTGLMDQQTRRAIQLFQRSVGLTDTGLLDQRTVDKLKARAAHKRGNPKPGRRMADNRPVSPGFKSIGNEKENR